MLWFVSLICFLYLFLYPLLIAIVTNYLCKMISEQINLLQTVSKVIIFYLLEAVRAKACWGKWDEKMYLSFAFPLGHLIIKRERDILATPGAVMPGCHGSSDIPLQGWEVQQGGLVPLFSLLTGREMARNPSSRARTLI